MTDEDSRTAVGVPVQALVRRMVDEAKDRQMSNDDACKFALWWSHKRKCFTTARQAAFAAWEEASRAAEPTRSQALAAAGFTRRPSLKAMEMRDALELIAAPMRPDGVWNRDREACRELAAEALGRYDDSETPNARLSRDQRR